MTLTKEWDDKVREANIALNALTGFGDKLADRIEELEPSPNTVPVNLSPDDMRLLRALASTAGTTPEDLASRYLAGRITNEARQLMGGS